MISNIRILFLEEDKEKIWETDYIVDYLFKSDVEKDIKFCLPDTVSSSEIWDVLVFNCRKVSYEKVLEIVEKTHPKIIIQLSDEYKTENLNHYNQLGNHCKLFLRQYHHTGYTYTDNTVHIPLGYCNGAGISDTENMIKMSHRWYHWSWYGDIKGDRWEMLDLFSSNVPYHLYHTSVSKEEMIHTYLRTRFVPCGRGNSTLDCYRLYEASMCGAISCVVGPKDEIEETFKYEQNPPWLRGETWYDILDNIGYFLTHEDELQLLQDKVKTWWKTRINTIRSKIFQTLETGEYQLTDESGENWFSYVNFFDLVLKQIPNHSKIVKIDSRRSKSSYNLAKRISTLKKDIELYCVNTDTHSYDSFLKEMKSVESHYFPLDISSDDASKKFGDKSLDFVFLNHSYTYEDIRKDIDTWLPKVKPGGILSGHYHNHEYDWCKQNKKAVSDSLSLKEYDIGEDYWMYRVPYEDDPNKFEGFPSINFISIEETKERRDLLYEKIKNYGITSSVTPHIYKRYEDGDYKIVSDLKDRIDTPSYGPVTSHLRAIREWYENTDEPYTFFCEDDLGFDTVKYWNFTWKEFFDTLPSDWGCVQLCILREDYYAFHIGLRSRCWCDWSGCAYLMSREHARKIIEHYYPDDTFNLNYIGEDMYDRVDWALVPVIETVIYSYVTKIYTCPLFVEDVKCSSSYFNSCGVRTGSIDRFHHQSYSETLKWWRTLGANKKPLELRETPPIDNN